MKRYVLLGLLYVGVLFIVVMATAFVMDFAGKMSGPEMGQALPVAAGVAIFLAYKLGNRFLPPQ